MTGFVLIDLMIPDGCRSSRRQSYLPTDTEVPTAKSAIFNSEADGIYAICDRH